MALKPFFSCSKYLISVPNAARATSPDKHCQTPEPVPLASRANPPAPIAAQNLTLGYQVQKALFVFHFRIPPLTARSPPNPAAPLGLRRAIYPMSRPLADEDPEPFARIRPTSNIRKARRDAASGCAARTYRDLARFPPARQWALLHYNLPKPCRS